MPAIEPVPSLDGRRFVLASSTSSAVDPDQPSEFRYFERDGVVWGDYESDTVSFGRFVGTRSGDTLQVSFVHVLVDGGEAISGSGDSTIESTEDGLRLVERFVLDGTEHVSICTEV